MSEVQPTPERKRPYKRRVKAVGGDGAAQWDAIAAARVRVDAARRKARELRREAIEADGEVLAAERALHEAIYGAPKEVPRG